MASFPRFISIGGHKVKESKKKLGFWGFVFLFSGDKQMNSRPCWCTPRWVYRLSGVSNFGSAAPPALRLDPSSNTASRITANVGSVSGLVPRPLLLSWQAKLMIILRDDVQDLRGIM